MAEIGISLTDMSNILNSLGVDPDDFEWWHLAACNGMDTNLFYDKYEADFNIALEGIFKLPTEARFGVYTAYKYYTKLLSKLKKTPSLSIQKTRIRVPNYQKISVLARSYLKYRLNLL